MPYTVTRTAFPEVLILEPRVFGDERGFFFESFNAKEFERATGLRRDFVQDNHSLSAHGVLRGLHYQIEHAQGKLIRVTQGEVFDVVVDMRRPSSTYGKSLHVTLTADDKRQLWVPEGFAHGFLVVSEVAQLLYKATDYWFPEHERSLLWNDPHLGIDWPIDALPQLAAKDSAGIPLSLADSFE